MDIFELFNKSKIITRENAPGLMGSIEQLASKANATMPAVRVAKLGLPNAAFHPVTNTLFITDGLLHMLDSHDLQRPASRELNAVLAHEMGHVRFKIGQMVPMVAMIAAMPLTAMAAMYLLEKTRDRVKAANVEDPEHPKHFWEEFSHVIGEAQQDSWKTFKDFAAYMHPVHSKITNGDRYKDKSWSDTLFDHAKVTALNVALTVASFAACRPLALKNEWQSDRFMLALTQDKEACLSAFTKLQEYSKRAVKARAGTHVQKSFYKKVMNAVGEFLSNTLMAHPELEERIKFIRASDPAKLARAFHL